MNVALVDLHRQHAELLERMHAAIREVLESGAFILGPRVRELEERIAAVCGVSHGIGCASGSDALLLSLLALDIGPGDEVITTPFSFFATVSAVTRIGAKPVLVDIDPKSYALDPALVEKAITDRTRAIMPVHLFGVPADIDAIEAAIGSRDIPIIEDAAQALGSSYRARPVGSLGRGAAISFYPTKNLGAIGDAGMIVTDDDDFAARARQLRVHGESERYRHERVGLNSRLDEVQAAALLVKLDVMNAWNIARREHAAYFDEALRGTPLELPVVPDDCVSIVHHYVVRAPRRDELRAYLGERGIATGIYYPIPLHRQPCFEFLGYSEGDLPEAERASRDVLALPVIPEVTEEQLATVARAIREFYGA